MFLFTALSACEGLFASSGESFHFTVTADPRNNHSAFDNVCQSINALAGGPGAFHVSAGDIDGRIWENRAIIDTRFGTSAIWYPVIGNHEMEDGVEMEWLRNEYDNGNNLRIPLKNYTNQDGPAGEVRTNYSWDYGNAHFIALNEYWNGGTYEGSGRSTSGSDTAVNGDIVPALYDWLAADLASCSKPFIFVFGHEPAFPYHRHVGDSLDVHKTNRNAFWELLETEGVTAYICGHTHYYSAHQGDANYIGNVWQFDVGNAGNDEGDGKTFFDVIVDSNRATINVYRDGKSGTFTKTDSFKLTPRICIGSFNPKKYTPGELVLVSLAVKPDVLTEVYAVEDAPPSGWMVSNINNGGTWDDVNKKVKWGPFYDNSQRTFTYDALPPEGTSCSQYFAGKVFVDGEDITCDRCIESAIPPEICMFGTFAGHKNAPLRVIDGNGTAVTFNLSGGGWGEILDVAFSRIILHDTTEKSVFAIKTRGLQKISVGDIIVEGPLKSILAGTTDLRGDISVSGSLDMLTVDDIVKCHSITIGPLTNSNAGALMKFDQVDDLTINSQMPIKTLSATEWLGGSINAPSVGNVTTKGDKKRDIPGNLDVNMTLDGPVNRVKVAGTLSGEWMCDAIKSVSATNIVEAKLTLKQKPDAKLLACGALTVKEWMDYTQILSAGNIGTVSAGAITNSSCFAGVTATSDFYADGVLDLPDPALDINYNEPATIKSIKISGIKNEEYCVINSNIAAANILSAYLAYPQTQNGNVPFGISADYIKKLTIKDAEGTISMKELSTPMGSQTFGDAQIRLY